MQLIETDRRGHGSIFSEAEFLKKQNYSEKGSYGKLQQIVEGNTKMATSNPGVNVPIYIQTRLEAIFG